MREIQGLRWVRLWEDTPPHAKARAKPRGAKAEGLRYERRVALLLPQATWGQWMEYEDAHGRGFAQADFLVPEAAASGAGIAVAEVKLTWIPQAAEKLRKFYFPLLREVYGKRFIGGMVIVRNVTCNTPWGDVLWDVPKALKVIRERPDRIPVVHWGHTGDGKALRGRTGEAESALAKELA